MTLRELLAEGTRQLEIAGIKEASNDAWILFAWAFDMDRTALLLHGNDESEDLMSETSFFRAIEKRKEHMPVQYIIGHAPFMGLDFLVTPAVLIPRFDTEVLVEAAMKLCGPETRVLDLCTGSGCIAISLANLTGCQAVAVDLSRDALDIAEVNKKILIDRLKNSDDRFTGEVTLLEGDMFSPVEGIFDIIVSNPPYIPPAVIATLDTEVKDKEPMMALDGGADGLDFYRILAKESGSFLKAGGTLMMEIGCEQANDVSQLLQNEGFINICVLKDLAGLDRVVCAVKEQEE